MSWLLFGGGLSAAGLTPYYFRRAHLLRFLATVLTVLLCAGGLVLLSERPTAAAGSVSDSDWAKILTSGGFDTPQKLETGLAIVFAESGGNPTARGHNTNGTVDRGGWQINSGAHAEVSDQCADDPVCATKEALRISNGGTNFGPWTTYTTGEYRNYINRASNAINAAAPGCDLVWDPKCPVELAWNGVIAATTGTATAASSAGLPGLPNPLEGLADAPGDVVGRLMAKAVASVLLAADRAALLSFEGLWNAMLAGEDNLGGKEDWGGWIVFDLTPVKKVWGIALGITTGTSLATLLVILGAIRLTVDRDPGHESVQLLFRTFVAVILMAGSFFLIGELIVIDNALTGAVNSGMALELRQLPSYQGLGVQNPPPMQTLDEATSALFLSLGVMVLILEMVLVTAIYVVRAIVLVALTVTAPFWILAGILPEGRGVTAYFLRLLLATVFMKFVNALIFGSFLLLAWTGRGLFNPLLIAGVLLVMILVPGTLGRALGDPHPALTSADRAVRAAVTYQPLRASWRELMGGVRSRLGRP